MSLAEELTTSQALADPDSAYEALIARLSRQSVDKHYDAYADIDWDAPEMAIDAADPCWELISDDPLGATAWYQAQTAEARARMGLERIVTAAKFGIQFENVLKRGLLEYTFKLPNGAPEFRYCYHEIAEETHHGMMFQELVNRSGINPRGLPLPIRIAASRVPLLGRYFPALFFVFVLGGEDPIDHVQRRQLREGAPHPLIDRIMRIHVTEEARHLSFARHYLKHQVPRLRATQRFVLSIAAPIILGIMAAQMLAPSRQFVRRYQVPRSVLKEAYLTSESRDYTRDAVRKVRRLCVDLGLVTPISKPIWKALQIWDDTAR